MSNRRRARPAEPAKHQALVDDAVARASATVAAELRAWPPEYQARWHVLCQNIVRDYPTMAVLFHALDRLMTAVEHQPKDAA